VGIGFSIDALHQQILYLAHSTRLNQNIEDGFFAYLQTTANVLE
jgi:hypothetical protein